MTTDHLGSTRLVTDQLGAVKDRKDYGAFGDETATAARVSALGYTTAEPTRKDYTGYEKDGESSLEFAQARYYSTTHGRYTSVDPLTESANTANPQTFNRYTYVANDPFSSIDPDGRSAIDMTDSGGCSVGYSFDQCGGSKGFWEGEFGDSVAVESQYHGDVPYRSISYSLYLERVTNAQNGNGFRSSEEVERAVATFWISYGYDSNNELWTDFTLRATFSYRLPQRPGTLNDTGAAFIKEMGRWGPVLQRTTNTMGAIALVVIAAPVVADGAVILATSGGQ